MREPPGTEVLRPIPSVTEAGRTELRGAGPGREIASERVIAPACSSPGKLRPPARSATGSVHLNGFTNRRVSARRVNVSTARLTPRSMMPTRSAASRRYSSEFGSTVDVSAGVFHGLEPAKGLKPDALAGTVVV